MDIPTIPNYIITSAIAAPALLKLGVPRIVSHMFAFYFGIMADLTPPVALAAFAAASISKASPMRRRRTRHRGFRPTPYAMAGVQPGADAAGEHAGCRRRPAGRRVRHRQGVARDRPVGRHGDRVPARPAERRRAFAFAAASLLIAALPATDEAGFAASALFIAWHWFRTRHARAGAASTHPGGGG